MRTSTEQAGTTATARAISALIDCDVHIAVPRVDALFPYLPAHWVEHVRQSVFKGALTTYYPANAPLAARPGSVPDDGPAGSSLALLQEHLLDPTGAEYAVTSCLYEIDGLHNPEAAVTFARAVNDWQIAEWFEKDARLRGSVIVPVQLPELAAQEIARVGGHPAFVQVLLPVRSDRPYGNRNFRPLWEAIAAHDLVAGIHFGGAPGNPPFPSGWPSYYFEEYAGMAQVAQSQLTSIVTEGVFDLFPSLRVALLECGFTWLPALMWRFDKEWRNLRQTVPWVKRAPSEYLRDHVRLTTLPLDTPPDWADMEQVIAQIGGDHLLLYGSDYPHRHTTNPLADFLPRLPDTLARAIRAENARALYHLER